MKTYTRDNKTYIETRSNTPNSKQKRIRKKKEEENNNNNSKIMVTVDVNRSIFSFLSMISFMSLLTNLSTKEKILIGLPFLLMGISFKIIK
jgi:hypothetical protein